MTDSIAVLPPGWRAFDEDGNLVPGGTLEFFNAGTTTPKTVYSNEALSTSLGAVVTCDADGYPTSDTVTRVLIYTGTAAYKVRLKNAGGTILWTHDNVRGSTPSPATSSTATPLFPVTAISSTTTIVTGDRGKTFQAITTGGTFVATLPSAITAGDNWFCGFVHDGGSNAVIIATVSSQTIAYRGQSRTRVTLLQRGEAVILVSNGAQWLAIATGSNRFSDVPGIIAITDRASTAPASPVAGARYILTGTGGAWSSFAVNDVVEADGGGGWLRWTPEESWLAWVLDENLFTVFDGSAWTDQTGMRRPTSITMQSAVFLDQKTSGTNGGTPGTAGTWNTATLNTTLYNTITGCSLASNQITLPTGTWEVEFNKTFQTSRATQLRFRSTTDSNKTYYATQMEIAGDGSTFNSSGIPSGKCQITVSAATEVFDMQYNVAFVVSNVGLGAAASRASIPETYATVRVKAVAPTIVWP